MYSVRWKIKCYMQLEERQLPKGNN